MCKIIKTLKVLQDDFRIIITVLQIDVGVIKVIKVQQVNFKIIKVLKAVQMKWNTIKVSLVDGTQSFAYVCANFTAYMIKNTVNVSVNKSKTNALCHIGASISCMSNSFFEKYFPNQKPTIKLCQIKSIVDVGDKHHPVLRVVNIEVAFGILGLKYPFYVVKDLHHSLILGHDFMEAHNVTLDIRRTKMTIQDSLKVCSWQTNIGYARTVKPTTIYANSEVEIPVKIPRVTKDEEVLLEPMTRLSQDTI